MTYQQHISIKFTFYCFSFIAYFYYNDIFAQKFIWGL